MALRRTSIAMQNQVFELDKKGFKIRRISKVLGISRNTVRAILRSNPDSQKSSDVPLSQVIDWQKIHDDFHKGVQIKTLWQERGADLSYWSFWKKFRQQFETKPKVTIRLQHNPGEKIFFDFTDGLLLTDRQTGKKIKTQLFVGVLPFSSYTCGEFVLDQKQSTFTKAIERAFQAIGGVPKYTVIDNLKAGVTRAHIYDPDTNQAFIEFANHWGFAVLPARPYKPKDKAAVEGGIGLIQRQFYGEVRDCIFYSLAELNAKFQEFLNKLNNSPMKDHGNMTRLDRFQNEKQNLLPLQLINFEIASWKTCKVHPDCHIQVEKKFYSVPYQFVGQTVKVRIKSNLIEVFSDATDPIAVHAKLKGSERASTIDAHYPAEQIAVARFEVKHAINCAQKIGPKTTELIQSFFNSDQPLKLLRRAQGILKLVQKNEVKPIDLEYAASQALLFGRTQFGYVKTAALFHKGGGAKIRVAVPERDPSSLFLHNQQQSED
jgi:transposase